MVQRSTFLHVNHFKHLNLSVSHAEDTQFDLFLKVKSGEKYITAVTLIEKYLKSLDERNLVLLHRCQYRRVVNFSSAPYLITLSP